MHKTKKFIITYLLPCILLTSITAPLSAAEMVVDDAALLTNLGIYDEADSMILENESVRREDLASILSVFYGITENEYVTETSFPDVSEYWASGHIMTLVHAGIMNGYADGLFRPQSEVTVEQAVEILVSLTGYKTMAEYNGGFPNGYFRTANEIGILKNSKFNDTKRSITKGELTKLLKNSLKIPLFQQRSWGSKNDFVKDQGDTLLTHNLNIYEIEGHLNAQDHTSLDYREPPGANKIRIADINLICTRDAYPHLGLNVKVYYRQRSDESDGEALHIEATGNNEVISISAQNILSATLKKITYEAYGGTRNVDIPSNVTVIFNGKRMTYFTEEHLKPTLGEIRLIDADKNGIYEYMVVESAVNYFVKQVRIETDRVTITEEKGKNPIELKTNDTKISRRIFVGGKAADLKDIAENTIISVYADSVDLDKREVKSDSTVFRIYCSDNHIKGTASEVGDDFVVIGEVRYPLVRNFLEERYAIDMGKEQTFYMNYVGDICAVDDAQAEGRYALLVAHNANGNAVRRETEVRMFTEDAQFKSFMCADTLKIDGYTERHYKDAAAYLQEASQEFAELSTIAVPAEGVWQLIKYESGIDGSLLVIDTIRPNYTVMEGDLTHHVTSASETKQWYSAAGCFAGKYGFGPAGVFFKVAGALSEDDSYNVIPFNSIQSTSDTLAFFDADDVSVSKVAISRSLSASGSIDQYEFENLMVLERFRSKLNDDGEPSTFMRGLLLHTRNIVEIEVTQDALDACSVSPGDFIRWSYNYNGVATVLEKVLSLDGTGTMASSSVWSGIFYSATRVSYGKALALSDTYINQYFEGTSPRVEPCRTAVLSGVFIFDGKNQKIIPATRTDIKTARDFGEADADMLGGYYRSGLLYTLIIYR